MWPRNTHPHGHGNSNNGGGGSSDSDNDNGRGDPFAAVAPAATATAAAAPAQSSPFLTNVRLDERGYPVPTVMKVVYRMHTEAAPTLHTVAVHHATASYGSQQVQWRPFDPAPWVRLQEARRARANAPGATDADRQDAWGNRWATQAGPVMGTAACTQQRAGCITGTEAATLAGVNPWSARDAAADGYTDTREWLLARKTGRAPADKGRNANMQRGIDEEQEAADLFEAVTGLELVREPIGFLRDADGLVGASPDRLCRWVALATEIKSKRNHFAFVPEHNYWWQMQQQMYVLGIRWNVYTQYISGGAFGGVKMPQIYFHLIEFNAPAFDAFLRDRVAPFMLDLARQLGSAPPEAAVRLAAGAAATSGGAAAGAAGGTEGTVATGARARARYTPVAPAAGAAAAAANGSGDPSAFMDEFAQAFAAATTRPSVTVGAPAVQYVRARQQQQKQQQQLQQLLQEQIRQQHWQMGMVDPLSSVPAAAAAAAAPQRPPRPPVARARPAWAKARVGQSAAARRIAAAAIAAAGGLAGVEGAAAAVTAPPKPPRKKRAPAGSAYVGLPAGARFNSVTPVRAAPRKKRPVAPAAAAEAVIAMAAATAAPVLPPVASRSVPKTEAAAKRRRTLEARRAADQRIAAGMATMQAAMMLLSSADPGDTQPLPLPPPPSQTKKRARTASAASAAAVAKPRRARAPVAAAQLPLYPPGLL